MTEFAALPWGDPGIGGPVGGDSTGGTSGGGSSAIPGVGGGSTPGTAPPAGGWQYWLNPFNLDPGPAFRQGEAAGGAVAGTVTAELAGIWEQITTGAPIVGVYLLLAALILIGVLALLLSSPVGQAAVRGTEAELTGGASEAGRAVGWVVRRRKKPPRNVDGAQ